MEEKTGLESKIGAVASGEVEQRCITADRLADGQAILLIGSRERDEASL